MALQFSLTAVGSIILQRAVNILGTTVVSAVGMSAKIQLLVMQPMETLGITMATFCAQNLGAGKLHRVKKGIQSGLLMVLVYSVAAGVFVFFAGRYAVMIFVDKNEPNLEIALGYVKQFQQTNAIFYWILGVLFIIRNSVQGLGYSSVTVLAGVSELTARAGIAFAFVPVFGFNAICFANPLAWFLADIMLLIIFIFVMRKFSKIPRRELKKRI
jgi:Na+-driven multidrug efflux pump